MLWGGRMSLLTNLDTWHYKPFTVVRHPASWHLLGTDLTPFSLQRCAREGVTVVSIGHAPLLPEYHDRALTAAGGGAIQTPLRTIHLTRGLLHRAYLSGV